MASFAMATHCGHRAEGGKGCQASAVRSKRAKMKNGVPGISVVLYAVAMVALIIGADIAFFRNRFWERLIANVGIVLVFAAFYLRFLRDL
jgi:uncharacterized membrane protein